MNTKQTALDTNLARTATIQANLERLQQLTDDLFGHDPDASTGATSVTSGGWMPGWTSCL